MQEEHSGPGGLGAFGGPEELAVDLHPVRGGEDHRFRIHHVLEREVGREGLRRQGAGLTAGLDHRLERAAPIAPEEGDAALDGNRQRFDAGPGGQGFGGGAGG